MNQNSLDATDHSSGRPVEVHFSLQEVDSSLFPARDDFTRILKACRDYWAENKKAKTFFEKAIATLESDRISVLKISDFFTTGLTGSDETKSSNWMNLIKSSGASDKSGGAGGSFGIGKHAPFACSGLRTVFYSTKDIEGKTAFQGVAKLVTHTMPDGVETQGTGYFGIGATNSPIKNPEQTQDYFKRSQIGTDLYLFGVDGGSDWQSKMIRSILENFFVAIHQRKLIVVVGNVRLDDTTLPELIKQYFQDSTDSDAARYYESFTSDESKFYSLADFEGLGEVELHVLPGPHFPKRVAMVRQTGMLVFYKGHFQTPLKFAGVLRATGTGINELLRSIENPSHTKWEPERHDDPPYAKRTVKKLFEWVRECVKQTSADGAEDEYDFDGMQQFLPDELEDEPEKSDNADGEHTVPQEVELTIREVKKAAQPNGHSPSNASGGTDDDGTKLTEPDEDNADTPPGTAQPGNNGGGGTNEGDESSTQVENGIEAPTRSQIALKKLRAFCSNSETGEYRVIFEPQSQGTGFIQLRVVGEVEESIAPAVSATAGGATLKINADGLIGPISFVEGTNQVISVVLANRLHCALEVAAYEN